MPTKCIPKIGSLAVTDLNIGSQLLLHKISRQLLITEDIHIFSAEANFIQLSYYEEIKSI
jgi:hypothetical protein